MTTTIRNLALSAAVLGLVATATPVAAQTATLPPGNTTPTGSPQGTFYELTENMRLIARAKPRRVAQSALIGTADIGTPFCPTALVRAVSTSADRCTLNVLGEDDISLATGQGTFDAKLTVVVNLDNAQDPAEFVIAKLRASGKMNFAPAILNGLPYGTITGRTHIVGSDDPPKMFSGVFRLPFIATDDRRSDGRCKLTPNPNPLLPARYGDLAYLDTQPDGSLTGKCLDIQLDELSIGMAAVRWDVWFPASE